MKNQWQIMGHASELPNVNDFLCLPWKENGELAIMRNANGSLTAFDNRCPHRGARIFTTLRGNRPPVCGYHGRMAKPDEVNSYHLIELQDWIFVREQSDFTEPPWFDDLVTFIGSAAKVSYHATIGPMPYFCHWAVAVENALDHEHIATVHGDTLATLGLTSEHVQLYRDGSSFERFRATNTDKLDRLCELFREPSPTDYFHFHLFPHTALSSTRGTSYSLQHYFPRADGNTLFLSRLYGTEAVNLHAGEAFLDSVVKFNRKVFAEDADVCALVKPFPITVFQPNEARIENFRAHL